MSTIYQTKNALYPLLLQFSYKNAFFPKKYTVYNF